MEMSMQIMKQFLLNEEEELHKNFVFSPLSINTLLSIVANGLNNGPSLDLLLSLLGFKTVADLNAKAQSDYQLTKDKSDDGPQLFSVNSFWIDRKYSLDPCFQKVLETVYKAESSIVDFENEGKKAVDKINAWVADATEGLIKDLLNYKSVSTYPKLFLVNALYFKGTWSCQFIPETIKIENFYLNKSDHFVQVPYMCHRDSADTDSYASSEGFKILKLGYKSIWCKEKCGFGENEFSMYIFLPDETDGLLKLLDQFSSNPNLITLQFEFISAKIRKLRIPKFKFKFNFRVSKIMKRMGLSLNDTGIVESLSSDDNIPLQVSVDDNIPPPMKKINIVHSSYIDVHEYGTEAAAATEEDDNMGFSLYSPPRPCIDFVADHPFMFMIREDNSGTPLFLGAVVNPLLD